MSHSKKGSEKAKRTGKIWFRLYLMLTIVVILFVSILNGSVLYSDNDLLSLAASMSPNWKSFSRVFQQAFTSFNFFPDIMRASIFKLGKICTVSSFQMNNVWQEHYIQPINPKQVRTQWHMRLQLLRHVLSAVIYHKHGTKDF